MTEIIEVLDPTARAIDSKVQIATRVSDLNGRVIGFLDNGKANADIFLARVKALLSQRFNFAEIIRVNKGTIGGAFAYPADLSEKLSARCDIVVNGVGDWGGCTSWSIHDSIQLEKRGTPTATIITDAFVTLAGSISAAKGLPSLPLTVIPHPLAGLPPEEVRAKADKVIERIVQVLTGLCEKPVADARKETKW